jgi:signal transduction histidine kinase
MPLPAAVLPSARSTLFTGGLLLAFVLLFGWQSWQAAKADQIQQLRTVAELTERAIDRYFVQMQSALADLAEDIVSNDGLSELARTQRRLVRFKSEHSELLAANLLALDGQFLATSATPALVGLPTAPTARDFAQIAARQRLATPMQLAQPLFGPASKRWILPIRYAVRDTQGALKAFIVAAAPVEVVQTFWSQAPVASTASIALVRDDGYLIDQYPVPAGTQASESYGKPHDSAVMQALRQQGFPGHGYVEGPNAFTGESDASIFKRLEHYPVTLVVGMPMSQFLVAWWHRAQLAMALAGLLAITGWLAYRSLHRREVGLARQRTLAEDKLRASEMFLERAGQVAKVGGWALDLESQQLTWSTQTCRIHEVPADYKPDVESAVNFYAPEARAIISAAVAEALRVGRAWDLELPLITAAKRSIWVRAQGEVEYEGGKPARLVGAFQDVTEYRQRRLELRREHSLREQAEMQAAALDKLLRERSEMIDVLAHEVRQPLNNASAALQGAKSALSSRDALQAADGLHRAQIVLGSVLTNIDNTLAVAALLASTAGLRREDTDIDMWIALTLGDMPEGEQDRIRVDRQTATRTASMDLGLMRLALRNLLVNALQYSANGSPVTVRVADSDEPLALVVDVLNGGVGIPGDLIPHVFERGTRGPHTPDRAGHGLGLYIVKRVMDLHGGGVAVRPEADRVTCMRLVINQAMPMTSTSPDLSALSEAL